MILYPQLIYPLSGIALTASIYMIVAITLERYSAVHYPVDYRQVRYKANFSLILLLNSPLTKSFLDFRSLDFFESSHCIDHFVHSQIVFFDISILSHLK